ncbi:MAG: 16S rRNA (uracil(1498)-N(3))-methyltransferase [Fimbriimonas sp.]
MSTPRSLPRLFIPGVIAEEPFELPQAEIDKLRKVLRLQAGAQIAVLPNDGTLIRCEFRGREAIPLEVVRPDTEPTLQLTLAQAFPKGDKLDDIIKSCTGIGVAKFVLFPSERTVVQWDQKKLQDRLRRFQTIAREEAEVSFRSRLPAFEVAKDLKEVLTRYPDATVLSEVEGLAPKLAPQGNSMTIVVGPEGGWSARELELIGDRGVTLGPRVLRVEHAGPAAAAVLLLR